MAGWLHQWIVMKNTLIRLSLLALALAPVVACGGAADEETGSTDEAIIKGKPATAFPEAVTLDTPTFLCSAVMIAPTYALTAGHCATNPSDITITAPNAGNQTARGIAIATSYVDTGDGTLNASTIDIAVVRLDRPISLSFYPSIPTKRVSNGSGLRNVGRTLDETPTNQLWLGKVVEAHTGGTQFPNSYVTGQVIEPGDSGGPAYAGKGSRRRVVGINSASYFKGKHQKQVLSRVDLATPAIQAFMAQTQSAPTPDSGATDGAD